jgi:hypothetical protein
LVWRRQSADPTDLAARALWAPLDKWKVVAGPPGVTPGSSYYCDVFPDGHTFTPMTMTSDGFKIKCAHCGDDFETAAPS